MKISIVLTGIAALFLLLAGCNNGDATACSNKDVVDTSTGSFCGVDKNNVTVFKGIKYADASQKNRWKKATEVVDFTEPRLADSFGDICSQDKQGAYALPSMSEDCLYLNVWKPDNADSKNLKKVMLYIHGGAFVRGSGSQPVYNGENLANKNDVIVVTFNYRLGVLGFLSPNSLTESGNFGLMDQQMAIKWVYENIERFGGDKESITIFGNSAGSASVGIHLSNNSEATSMIKAGIMQSAYMGLPLKDKTFADTIRVDTISALRKICDNQPECYDISDLNASAIVAVKLDENVTKGYSDTYNLASTFLYHPYIDDMIIKEDLLKATISKPLLIGNSKDESNFIIVPAIEKIPLLNYKLGYEAYVFSLFGLTRGADVLNLPRYQFDTSDPSSGTALKNLFNDFAFVCASRHFLGFSSAQNYVNNKTYLYYNGYQSSFNYWGSDTDVKMAESCEAPAVCHQAEIPYLFDNYYDNNATAVTPTDEERQFSQKIMGLWGDFAKETKFGDFIQYSPIPAEEYSVDWNNTSPNLFERQDDYEEHHCSLWNDYYDSY